MPRLPKSAKALLKEKFYTGEWTFGTVCRALSDILIEYVEDFLRESTAPPGGVFVPRVLNAIAKDLRAMDEATRKIL